MRFNPPTWLSNCNFETMSSFFAFAWDILASKSKLLDCITSRVVLVFPESYSKVIPSLAISAAFNWAAVETRTLSADWKKDQEFAVWVFISFFLSSNNRLFFSFLCLNFLIDEKFLPPCIIGHEIVAFTVSCSSSSIVELKSLFSVFE